MTLKEKTKKHCSSDAVVTHAEEMGREILNWWRL